MSFLKTKYPYICIVLYINYNNKSVHDPISSEQQKRVSYDLELTDQSKSMSSSPLLVSGAGFPSSSIFSPSPPVAAGGVSSPSPSPSFLAASPSPSFFSSFGGSTLGFGFVTIGLQAVSKFCKCCLEKNDNNTVTKYTVVTPNNIIILY